MSRTHVFLCLLLSVGLGLPRLYGQEQTDLRKLVTPKTKLAIDEGLRFLSGQQQHDGSFGSGTLYRKSVGVTGLCGMAFLAGGHTPGDGKYGQVVDRCVNYLLTQTDTTGFIGDPRTQSHGPMYGHGFAVTFLAEAYGMAEREDLRPKLAKSIKLIIASQNKEGGWRYEPKPADADISVTVCMVMALRAGKNAGFHVPKETIDAAIEYIRKSQNSDGGFRYQMGRQPESAFARSAAAVVGLYSAGIYEGDEIDKGLRYLSRYRPSPNGIRPYQLDHYFYGHYYAVQVMWQRGGDDWSDWYAAIRDQVVGLQSPRGGWDDRTICPEYSSAMALLILETPYNFLPIFQK